MAGLFLLWSGFVSLYIALAVLGARVIDAEEKQQEVEFIESVGGEDSPWMNPEITTSPWVSPEYFTSKYSTWDRQFYESIPNMPEVRPQSQAPAPVPAAVPSSRPHTERAVTDEISGLQPVTSPHNVTHNPSELWEDWIDNNDVYFPLEVPPKEIDDEHSLRALNEAKHWIKKAIAVGVPQSRVQTDMFGVSKGGGGKSGRVRDLYKEIKKSL